MFSFFSVLLTKVSVLYAKTRNKPNNRLKGLLLHDEDKCLEDAAALHLNEDQKFEKLKQKTEILKKQREEERMKVVREKRELQFL